MSRTHKLVSMFRPCRLLLLAWPCVLACPIFLLGHLLAWTRHVLRFSTRWLQ